MYYNLTNITNTTTSHPELITSVKEPNVVCAISFEDGDKKYYFSNKQGHTVIEANGAKQRQMRKKEFKSILGKMIECVFDSDCDNELLLEEIQKLNYAEGHANKTFEVVRPLTSLDGVHSLIINLGTARYIYNQEENTVLQIDHSKRINGTFLQEGPEKDEIIHKIASSKTMTKKLATLSQH